MEKIKWAFTATGNIANQFAQGLAQVEDAEISAVTGINMQEAERFAGIYGIKDCYDNVDQMLENADFDVVYICTPNFMHYEQCMKCFELGKNVLCEKPLADNVAQTKRLIEKAREKGVFFMEGMWTRFFPVIKKAKEWIEKGEIGDPKTIFANFGTNLENENQPWRASRKAAGGSLRDVSIYTIAFTYMMFGPQDDWMGTFTSNGEVDVNNNLMLKYNDGRAAFMSALLDMITQYDAIINGTRGRIVIDRDFWRPMRASLFKPDGTVLGEKCVEVFEEKYAGSGFQYEAMAVMDCLRKGLKETKEMPLDETIRIAAFIEEIRKSWGIIFDSDEE